MRITILRIGLAIKEKENAYNVQEIGLSKALNNMGHEANVVYFLNDISNPVRSSLNTNVTYFPCKAIGHQIIISEEILSHICCDGIIIFCDNKLSTDVVIRWCKRNSLPYLCYFGLFDTDSEKYLNRLLGKLITQRNLKLLRNSYNVTKTNAVSKRLMSRGIPVRGVIPVGLDRDLLQEDINVIARQTYRNELGINFDEKVLLFVGRLTEAKMPCFAIDLLESLNTNSTKYHLIIIGAGKLKEQLINRIANSSQKDRISYFEHISYESMFKFYAAADCFLNFSSIEIFGMAILEAMYYGCIVFAHAAPGPLDIISTGHNGVLMNDYDINHWCDSISKAITLDSIRFKAISTIKEKYMWDHIANQFLQLLEEQKDAGTANKCCSCLNLL